MKMRTPLPMMIIIPLLMECHFLMGLVFHGYHLLSKGIRRRALLPTRKRGARM
ncbi:hypothetical protein Taro_010797 [Colocasia esculenta]|uniref:Uncharacterized protein n=1 Tax=Colocasia esculenta TaxID=4460 RepID=A0A843U982_COLES|nr:hypothetical protein [Colocasia esculenta]